VFRGANAEAQRITAREWICAGPSETGKTWATLWRLDALLRATPGAQAALVRKVRVSIGPTVLVTYRRVIAQSGSGATPYGGNNPEWYDYPNGARLWIGGMDDPSKILSGERDFIYVNQAEDLTQADWETLTTRNTGRGAVTETPMLFGDCNPGPADHWILRRRDSGALRLMPTTHRDNPSLYDDRGVITQQGERTTATLNALTGTRRLRLRDGLWVGAEGQFFTEWDEARHVCPPFAVPQNWRVWAGFDYGYSHNTACYLLAEGDGEVWIIGEHVACRWLPAQHVAAIAAMLRRVAPWLTLTQLDIVAGHDVFAQKGDAQAQTIAQQYEALGLRFRKAQIDRISRAAELARRLGNQAAGLAPTIRVFATCPRLITTIPALVVDPHRSEDVLKTDADSEGLGGDDPYDGASYGLMEVAQRPGAAAVGGSRPQAGTRR
jgi:phage terminase large subunit